MKSLIPSIFLFFVLLNSTDSYAQIDSINNHNELKINTLDNLIKLKSGNKQECEILIQFKQKFGKADQIVVEEFIDYFQLIVTHPSADGYSGGAECYKLDKKTGESSMVWHEHPMKYD